MESHVSGDFRLLSLRQVSKELGIGYVKLKKLVSSGHIQTVFDSKKIKVPAYKLKEFLDRNTFMDSDINEQSSAIHDHEAEAESIFQTLKRR
jgi:hypothetical protein